MISGRSRTVPNVPQKYSTLLRGSNKMPMPFQPPDHEQLGIDSPFDRCFPRPVDINDSDYRPARFAVPARVIDTQDLFTTDDACQDGSDDEEALKLSYENIMGRLKGGSENTQVYHTASFGPRYFISDHQQQSSPQQQYHNHHYQQQQYIQQNYAQFQQQHAALDMSTDSLLRMQYQSHQQKLEQGRAHLESARLRQAGVQSDAASPALPAHIPSYMRADGGIRAEMAYQRAKGVAATSSVGTNSESVQEVHLQNWLQEGVGAFMQAQVQQQQQQKQQPQQQSEDLEADSLLGSFKSIQSKIHMNLGLLGSQARAPPGSAAGNGDAPHAAHTSVGEMGWSTAANVASNSFPPRSRVSHGGGGSVAGRGLDGRQAESPSKRSIIHVVAAHNGAHQARTPSLVVDGVSGCGPGALSLAATTTREQLRYHYDIKAPSIEDEAYESALLAGRGGAVYPLPQDQRPQPSVYEPIYRYPVDSGGDGTFEMEGFIKRAQALGDSGDHWGLASEIIREHLESNNQAQIRGTHPAAAAAARPAAGSQKPAIKSAVSDGSDRSATSAHGAGRAATAGGSRARVYRSGGAADKGAAGVLAGNKCGGAGVASRTASRGPAGRRVEDAAGASRNLESKEKKAYGEDTCEDGITTSLSALKTRITAAGQMYSTASKTIKEMHKADALRATQRKTLTSKPGGANKVRAGSSKEQEEAVDEQPKTWAHKVKRMQNAASDIKPLISMAEHMQASSSRRATRPASAAVSSRVGASPSSSPSPAQSRGRRGELARPSSASGGARPSSAGGRCRMASGTQTVSSQDAKHAKRKMRGTDKSIDDTYGSCSTETMDRTRPRTAPANGSSEAQESDAEDAAHEAEQYHDGVNGINEMNGYHNMYVEGRGTDGIVDGEDPYSRDEEMDMYARDEAIGVRPKSRRGRGINGRGPDDQQHLAEEAPQMGDDEMARDGREEDAGEEDTPSGYEGFRQDNGAAYALDEAQGTRPRSRRGRGMRSRDGAGSAMDGVEPQMGDDEALYDAPRPDDQDGDGDDDNMGDVIRGLEACALPKIDEATGMRPPSRRGRPSSRAAALPHQFSLGRRHAANTFGAGGEFGEVTEAGRELFSDCTTPDAPEDADGVHHLSPGRPLVRADAGAGVNGNWNGLGVGVGSGGVGTPVRPSVVSERMLVHRDDDDGESDDQKDMARRANHLIATARQKLDAGAGKRHIQNTDTANAMAAAAAAAFATHGGTARRDDIIMSASSEEDEEEEDVEDDEEEEMDGKMAAGMSAAGTWQRQEDVLRRMNQQRNDILMRAVKLQGLAAGVQI